MSKCIITSHFVNDKNKEGEPYKTKKEGKPFQIVNIKVAENPKKPQEWDGKYLSCMAFNKDDAFLFWQIGDEVDIAIEKNNDFWNFKTPSKFNLLEIRVKVLEDLVLPQPEELEELPDKEELPTLEHDETIPF